MSEQVLIPVSFGAPQTELSADGAAEVHVPTAATRPVHLQAKLHRPGVIRDALLALGDVLASDLRRKASDRADYLAYLIGRGKGVNKQVWDAQKEYLALQYSVAAKQDEPLDPILSITKTAVRFEVLSGDESVYAQLTLKRAAAFASATENDTALGTTYVDLESALSALRAIRSYRPTTLVLAPTPAPTEPSAPTDATRSVSLRWLRAFGQMQAATLLAVDRFELAPIDLYNVLLQLRMHKAKTAPRGLRYELVPGEPPRIVLEPWDLVVRATGGNYRGTQPRIIRTWGRHRLNVLASILPHAKKLEVAVSGAGLPAMYNIDFGDATLSLALSSWTDASWAGIATFDLLAADDDAASIDRLIQALDPPATLPVLAARLALPEAQVRRTVLAGLTQLRLGCDLATGEIFARELLATPLPANALKYRDAREAAAHRLLGEPGAVTLTKVHDRGAEGRSIEGQVVDAKAHRTFHPTFTLDLEARTLGATCTCSAFRRSGIKEGPCEHMMALRVAYARELARLEAARATPEGRAMITAETRVLIKRTAAGAETYRLSLDDRLVTARYGIGTALRMQRLRFDSTDAARGEYFARLTTLATKGYLDATQE